MGKKLSKVKKTDNYEVAQNEVDDDDDEEGAFSGQHLKKNKEKTSVNVVDKMMDERRQEKIAEAEEARQSTSQDAPRAKIHKQPNVPEEDGGS